MKRLYRITTARYADDVSGTGGLFFAGRWHQKGTRILYTSEYTSLAKLEMLANYEELPTNMSLVTLELPDGSSITNVDLDQLPKDWMNLPYKKELTAITEAWIKEGRFWVMRVPSAHSPNEFNFLLNPQHPEHQSLKIVQIEPHGFDSRLK